MKFVRSLLVLTLLISPALAHPAVAKESSFSLPIQSRDIRPTAVIPEVFSEAIAAAEGEHPEAVVDTLSAETSTVSSNTRLTESGFSVESPHGELGIKATDTENSIALVRENGAQVLTELAPGDSRASFEITLPEAAKLEPNEEGGFEITLRDEGISLDLGSIEAPWAVDATGRLLDTSYSTKGTKIIQTVDTEGANFPVIADPRLTYGLGVYINLMGAELKAITGVSYTALATSSIVACSAAKLPHPIAKIVKVLCVVVGSSSVRSILKNLKDLAKTRSIKNSSCYQSRIIPQTRKLKVVPIKGNCLP